VPSTGCTYYVGKANVLEQVIKDVDVLEVCPDSLISCAGALPDSGAVKLLQDLSADFGLVLHGVGMSIASYDGPWEDYFSWLDVLFDHLTPRWHSEHLGYTRVEGHFLGTMLPAPRTHEMLDLLASRVSAIQERYGVPFLLENVVGLVTDFPGVYSDAEFLNSLVEATGCGLLLDVYNLRCDCFNRNIDVDVALEGLALDAVVELHVAEGVHYRGLALDVHSRTPSRETLELAMKVAKRCSNLRLLTFEFLEEAVESLGVAAISESLIGLRDVRAPRW
jgi:hypothetical protein